MSFCWMGMKGIIPRATAPSPTSAQEPAGPSSSTKATPHTQREKCPPRPARGAELCVHCQGCTWPGINPASHGALGHNTGANRGSSEQTVLSEQKVPARAGTWAHRQHLKSGTSGGSWQQQALQRCSRLPLNPHSLLNLVLRNPSEPEPQALLDAPMNKLHSHKVIKQLTAVQIFFDTQQFHTFSYLPHLCLIWALFSGFWWT